MMIGQTIHVGRRGVGPFLLVPAAAEDPLSGFCRSHARPYNVDDVAPVGRLLEIQSDEEPPLIHQVCVTVDETGHGQPAVQINNLRLTVHEGFNVLVASHRHDPVTADAQRLSLRRLAVDGYDLAIDESQIGGLTCGIAAAQEKHRGCRYHQCD